MPPIVEYVDVVEYGWDRFNARPTGPYFDPWQERVLEEGRRTLEKWNAAAIAAMPAEEVRSDIRHARIVELIGKGGRRSLAEFDRLAAADIEERRHAR